MNFRLLNPFYFMVFINILLLKLQIDVLSFGIKKKKFILFLIQ
jgi:hypothetical protein